MSGFPVVAGESIAGASALAQLASATRFGVPIADNTFTHAAVGGSTSVRTTRKPHTVAVACTDLRFIYSNWLNQGATGSPVEQDTDNANSITIAASVEISGVKYRLNFNGVQQVTLNPGSIAVSDPLPVLIPAGTVIYSWTYVTPLTPGTTNWYPNSVNNYATGQGGTSAQRTDTVTYSNVGSTITDATIAAVDLGKPVAGTNIPVPSYVGTVTAGVSFVLSSTPNTSTPVSPTGSGTTMTVGGDLTLPGIPVSTIPDSSTSGYVPSLIAARPLQPIGGATAATPVALLVGDSLMAGSNDLSANYGGRNVTTPAIAGGGFTARALVGKVPYIMAALSGDQASLFVQSIYSFRRMTWGSLGTTMLCNYGRNDLSNARTLAQIQANLLGQRVIQYTITPYTDSTDGYITTTNQSSHTGNQEAIRLQLNAWIRAGAPVASAGNLTAVAVGTANALVAGQSGHPLYSFFEVASAAESAPNSGLWTTLGGRTITDGAISSGFVTFTSPAQAAFTAADVGKTVTIAGAGTAGAILQGVITTFNSATSVGIIVYASANGFNGTNSAGATVSGATCTIGVASTVDGLHPCPQLAGIMAGVVNAAQII